MWISKDKYENLMNSIKQQRDENVKLLEKIKSQQECIDQLMRIHDLHKTDYYGITMGEYFQFNRNVHEEPTTTIGDIDNLTFTELAEYVINGKPITRVREHEVVVCPKEDEK